MLFGLDYILRLKDRGSAIPFPPIPLKLKPPLSNQKTGIVTSVNFENRLRPIILVYDEHFSPDEPIVLNLAKEEDSLIIVEAIRPADLAPQIRACLNPRRIISYFPSNTPVESCATQ